MNDCHHATKSAFTLRHNGTFSQDARQYTFRRRRLSSAFDHNNIFLLLAIISLINNHVCKATNTLAFTLSGHMEIQSQEQKRDGGRFAVYSFESNAIVDVTFGNGYREIVGTDGKDSFLYCPYYCESCKHPVGTTNSQAIIQYGRLPIEANFVVQLLWIMNTHDPLLLTNLQTLHCPFYGAYKANDITERVAIDTNPPFLPQSIQWFAPDYLVSGTNHYKLLDYTDGRLMAEVSITQTQALDGLVLPQKIRYVLYNTSRRTNAPTLGQLPQHRNRYDVTPAEITTFIITNVRTNVPMPSYVPMIKDKSVRVNDKRMSIGWATVSSGRWWKVRDIYIEEHPFFKHGRLVTWILLLLVTLFPVYVFLRRKSIINSKTNT